jgi:spore maturation protein CgeB
MTVRPLDIVVLGLSLTSSWGNGHATTFRALLKGLHEEGHNTLFLERDVPWYAGHRDMPAPDFCELALYRSLPELFARFGLRLARADSVIVGSYVPEGAALIDRLLGDPAIRPVLFYDIDTPVTLAMLDRNETAHLRPDQIRRLDAYLSFAGGRALDHLRTRHGARRAEALYCAADVDRYRSAPDPVARWDLGYLGTYSDDRQPTLEALLLEPARRLPDRQFVVAGPMYPDTIDWPANVERIDHLPPARHAAFYNAQRFTLNVTRADMRRMGWSPSVRLFEAAACGTPIISDDWPGLDHLFPDDEAIVIAQGTDDVIAALTKMPDGRRRDIGRSARARVLRWHSGRARARQLARVVETVTRELADRRRIREGHQ